MWHYFTASKYDNHNLELDNTELFGPFRTEQARRDHVEWLRKTDYWNLGEDTVTLLMLDADGPLIAGESMHGSRD